MELNSLLFPAPSCNHKPLDYFGEILYVPKYYKKLTNKNSKKTNPKDNKLKKSQDKFSVNQNNSQQ